MEEALQQDFADLFARIVASTQTEVAPWQGSPFRELVAGVAPRAVQGLIVRCLVALCEARGLSAGVPARGERSSANLSLGASRHYYVKSATVRDPSSPSFQFHALDANHPTILIGIAPRRVHAWLLPAAMVAEVTRQAPVDRRVEVDPRTVPWSGGPCGDGSLSVLLTTLKQV